MNAKVNQLQKVNKKKKRKKAKIKSNHSKSDLSMQICY